MCQRVIFWYAYILVSKTTMEIFDDLVNILVPREGY